MEDNFDYSSVLTGALAGINVRNTQTQVGIVNYSPVQVIPFPL